MKNIAVVGLGNHVRKNIIPTFEQLDWRIKYFVVRDRHKYKSGDFQGTIVDDVTSILADRSIDYFYIATPISTHYDYAKQALLHGHNVICEKPITVRANELAELNQIAKTKRCWLHQVEMYKYHAQFSTLKALLESGKYGQVKQATFSFKIPHLAPSDIRYDPKQAGGALFDVGFYPLSAALALFPLAKLQHSYCCAEPDYRVNLHGVALLNADGIIINCLWSIGACYENKIVLDFSNHRIVVDRAFSKPASLNTTLQIIAANGEQTVIETGCDDQFFNMFSAMVSGDETDWMGEHPTQKTISMMEAIFEAYCSLEGA